MWCFQQSHYSCILCNMDDGVFLERVFFSIVGVFVWIWIVHTVWSSYKRRRDLELELRQHELQTDLRLNTDKQKAD